RRPVVVGQHIEHAVDAARLADVDARDAALGDGGGDDGAISEARHVELGRIFGGAGDLGAAVDPGGGSADESGHGGHRTFLSDCDCGVPFAACVKARTMARRASSILNALWAKPFASRSTRSAACANAAGPAR